MPNPPARIHLCRGAFSLIELLVVIILVGLSATAAMTLLVDSTQDKLLSAARILVQDLEYAQSQALMTRQVVSVTFTPSTNTYGLSTGGAPLVQPFGGGNYAVSLTQKIGVAVTFQTISFGDTSNVISFGPDGEPLRGLDAIYPIASGSYVRLRALQSQVDVKVSPVTGKTRVDPVL